ncbi:MAG: hypothetical protein DRN10_03300, partial [Thermoplasmata archaeon]
MKRMLIAAFCISILLSLSGGTSTVDVGKYVVDTQLKEIRGNESAGGNIAGSGTEYWALIVAVGVYANNPDMDRPSMLVESEKLRKMLPVSSNWNESHIKVIEGENATVPNIIEGFRWLDKMEDEDDISLIYLTTHGFPILFDLPPFDEADGMDEALATYRGFLPFPNPWSW